MTKRTLPLLLVAAIALVACASPAPSGSGPDEPVSTTVPPTSGPPPAQKPKFVDLQPGLLNVTPIVWIKAVPSSDGMTLALWFWGGPCMGIDHADVSETADQVTVTLYQGTPPDLEGSACPEIAMLQAVRVSLSSPLGDRKVVDGAPDAGT
jgi:hypothetical protein